MVVAARGVKGPARSTGLAATRPDGYSPAATSGRAFDNPAVPRHEREAQVPSMNPVHWLIDTALELYIWIVIASVILSWLVAFNVINARNSFINQIGEFLYRVTEPALRPIRNLLPNLGGIDISPMILILLLVFARRLLWQMFA
jgi:YggT family protein